jgi:hypothetical protein
MTNAHDEKHVVSQVDTIDNQVTPHHAPVAEIAIHHDKVAQEAVGGLYEEMPPGYYRSVNFIGTVVVCS